MPSPFLISTKRILTILTLIFFILSCNKKRDVGHIISSVLSDSSLNGFPTKSNELPLSLIQPLGYHGDEVPSDFGLKKWAGIFKDQNGYYLDSTAIIIETCYDPVIGEEETDTLSWTAKCIQAIHTDSCLYLISGLNEYSYLKKHYLDNVYDDVQYAYPSDTIVIDFFGKKYFLYGKADVTQSEYSPEELVYINYELYLRGTTKNNKEITQILGSTTNFDFNMFSLLFVGDIDNDGFPDFIINTSEHYNAYQPTLYLSSFAQDNELVSIAAIHRSVGC